MEKLRRKSLTYEKFYKFLLIKKKKSLVVMMKPNQTKAATTKKHQNYLWPLKCWESKSLPPETSLAPEPLTDSQTT